MTVLVRSIKLEDSRDVQRYLFIQAEADGVREQVMRDLEAMKEGILMRCLAEVNGKIVGQTEFRKFVSPIKAHLVEVGGMVVNGEYQGKGISSLLMDYGLNWAKKQGIEKAILTVRKATTAEEVYKHQCFHVYWELIEGIKEPWGNKCIYDEVLMFKQLPK